MFTITAFFRWCFILKTFFLHQKSSKNCQKGLFCEKKKPHRLKELWACFYLHLLLVDVLALHDWMDKTKWKEFMTEFVNDVHSGLRQNWKKRKSDTSLEKMSCYPYDMGMLGNVVAVIHHFGWIFVLMSTSTMFLRVGVSYIEGIDHCVINVLWYFYLCRSKLTK